MKPFSLSLKPKTNKSSTTPTATTSTAVNSSFESIKRKTPLKEFVTEFDSSKPVLTKSIPKIIPPKPNEWQPYKKMKNLQLPLTEKSIDPNNQPLQFEIDNGSHVEPGSDSISFGLNIRQQDEEDVNEVKPPPGMDPMLFKLKEDLKNVGEENELEDYSDVPVEGFGAALLGGYGWKEGSGIGKNRKDVKVVEIKKWTGKEGLGFTSEVPNKDSKVKEKKGLQVGKEVRIVNGSNMGMKGKVLEVKNGGEMVVLSVSRSEVVVKSSDVAELGSVEEDRCLWKLNNLKIKEKEKERERDSKDKVKEGKYRETKESSGKSSWLTSHIRVRIISKELKRGKLYLKKGEIMDVVGPRTCDISMDGTKELIQGVDQELLETALPKIGGSVLILYGRHKGVFGNLVEKDNEKETGLVRDADTHELLNVRLEQIAEYIGDPSYIGY